MRFWLCHHGLSYVCTPVVVCWDQKRDPGVVTVRRNACRVSSFTKADTVQRLQGVREGCFSIKINDLSTIKAQLLFGLCLPHSLGEHLISELCTATSLRLVGVGETGRRSRSGG